MTTKKCAKCKVVHIIEQFGKNSRNRDSLDNYCKMCMKEKNQEQYYKHQQKRLEKKKLSYWKNPEKYKAKQRKWRINNPEKSKIVNRRNYKKNKEIRKLRDREYILKNREKITITKRLYQQRRVKIDPSYRLSRLIRNRFKMAISNKAKRGSAVRDLGMPIHAFLVYINLDCLDKYGIAYTGNESKFHLDHIQPLAKFDLTDRTQLLIACNWQNMQVLTISENTRKGKR